MLRRVRVLLIFVMLFVPLFLSGVTFAQTEHDDFALPDLSYYLVTEVSGQSISSRLYVKDGKIYIETANQLRTIDDLFIDQIGTMLMEYLEEHGESFEFREVGTEIILGHRTTHYQVFSKDTGLLRSEEWVPHDLPLPYPLQSISYDEEGSVLFKRTILELDLDPDFSGLDFSAALPSSSGFTSPMGSLTQEEFQTLVPWYDISQMPLPGFELTHIQHDYRDYSEGERFSTLTLTYSEGTNFLRVRVFGETTKLAEIHGPSEFSLLPWVMHGGFPLEPAIKSQKTNIMVGFMDPIDRGDGNNFLKSVVIY